MDELKILGHRRSRRISILMLIAVVVATVLGASSAVSAAPQGPREGVVLVAFAPGTEKRAMSQAGEKAGVALAKANPTASDAGVPFAEYKSDSLTTEELIEQFKDMPGVVAVSGDYVDRIAVAPAPNDPYYYQQWGLEQSNDCDIDARTAWGYTYGSPDVVVAVIDTGVAYNHPDLGANMWHNPGEVLGDGIDNDSNGYIDDYYGVDTCTRDGETRDGDPWDEHYHGTHVAGIIAATANNYTGVAGVAPGVRIMAVRAFDPNGYAYQSDIIDGINYIIDMKVDHDVNVVAINASIEGTVYNSVYEAAVQAAGDAGILLCAAAGNSGLNLDTYPRYPASFSCDNVIAVGATDSYDNKASFSNYSDTQVDLFAPGTMILSTIPMAPYYGQLSGTSMATPHVSGTVALVAAGAPWQPLAMRKSAILDTVDYRSGLAAYCVADGRLNAGGAVASGARSLIEQTDSRLTFWGKWGSYASSSASGGSYYATSTPGEAVTIEFTGPSVSLLARTTPWYGEASVSVDGSPEGTIDFYSSTTQYKNLVYSTGERTDAAHTITIECLDSKNPSSVGYGMSVDAFEVWGVVEQAPVPTRYQQDHSDFEYVGPWSTSGTDWSASGGTYASVDAPGSSVNVEFTGTYCAWVARTAPWYGKALVVLDAGTPGEKATTVDLYSSSVKYKQVVCTTGLVDSGTHTLSIYWTGEKNGSSSGTRISTDTFDIMGTTVDADAAAAISWRYQESNANISYLGDWASASASSASGGSFTYTYQPGAAAVAEFTGTEATLLLRTTPWYGYAEIYVDGVSHGTVDLYSPAIAWKVPLYTVDGLPLGEHTIAVECTGDKNASSTGTSIGLDAVDVTGYLEQALAPTRADDNNTGYATYEPAWPRWDNSGYWAASQDTYAYTDTGGNKVTVTFHGTHMSWVSRYSNTQGMAKVTLDGNTAEAVTIDLYSPSTQWKKRVYSTGLLTDDWHTVVIECLGTKNPASWWQTIGVDAFDIIETAP